LEYLGRLGRADVHASGSSPADSRAPDPPDPALTRGLVPAVPAELKARLDFLRLQLKHDDLLSIFAFNVNFRLYSSVATRSPRTRFGGGGRP
jgi:hypothetical protein